MFDFSKYNLGELNAIYEMLDYIDHGGWASYEMDRCNEAIADRMEELAAAEAEKVDRIKEACIAGAPPAEEPEQAPDMFGWVGDALDGLHV